MKIKEIPINDRPVERLINKGSEALSNDELLAILLRTGTKEMSAKDLGTLILNKVGIGELRNITYEQLISIKGVGSKKAGTIMAAIELSKRMNQKVVNLRGEFNDPLKLYNHYREILKDKNQEHFYVVYLDIRNKIIKDKLLFIGTANYSTVHPRDIFKEAYLNGAISIVVIHNHPSGEVLPSKNDLETTKQLVAVGNLLGIKVMDHIIIGENKYYSFCENGDIWKRK